MQWLKTQPATMLHLSAVTIGEIRKGLSYFPRAAAARGWGVGFTQSADLVS
jgi:hypothetical protein